MRYWLLAQIMLGSMGLCLVWPDTQGLGPLWPIRGEYCDHWPITAHLVDVLHEHVVQSLQTLLVVILVKAGEHHLQLFDWINQMLKMSTIFSPFFPESHWETLFLVFLFLPNQEATKTGIYQYFRLALMFSSSSRSTVGPQNSPSRCGWMAITTSGFSTFLVWINLSKCGVIVNDIHTANQYLQYLERMPSIALSFS